MKHVRVAALVVLAALAVLALPASASAAQHGCADQRAGIEDRLDHVAAILAGTNAHRARLGLRPLRLAPLLTRAATWKAREGARHGYVQHDDLAHDGRPQRGFQQRLVDCGRGTDATYSENVIANLHEDVAPDDHVAGWLSSTEHRRNLEDPRWRYVGIGVASSTDPAHPGVYAVQVFGSQSGAGYFDSAQTAPRGAERIQAAALTAARPSRTVCPPGPVLRTATTTIDDVSGAAVAQPVAGGRGCISVTATEPASFGLVRVRYRTSATSTGAARPLTFIAVTGPAPAILDTLTPMRLQPRVVGIVSRVVRSTCGVARRPCYSLTLTGRLSSGARNQRIRIGNLPPGLTAPLPFGTARTGARGRFTFRRRELPLPPTATNRWFARNAGVLVVDRLDANGESRSRRSLPFRAGVRRLQ